MALKNPRIERLRELMNLEERRAVLQGELESLTARMSSLRDTLFEESGTESDITADAAARSLLRDRPSSKVTRNGRMRRGALRDQVLTALEVAGDTGIKVTDLAKAIGIKPVNVYSWFHSALKRFPQIIKIDGGHYRLEGKIERPQPTRSASSEQRMKSGTSRGLRRRAHFAPRSRRGELTKRILQVLGEAPAEGVSVRELAQKVGSPYKNIYIWFATTGKKSGTVEKVTPGFYKLGHSAS